MRRGIPKRLKKDFSLKHTDEKLSTMKDDVKYMCFHCPKILYKFMFFEAVRKNTNIPNLIVEALSKYLGDVMKNEDILTYSISLIQKEAESIKEKYGEEGVKQYLKEVREFISSKIEEDFDANYVVNTVWKNINKG
jgi:phosphoribosyl-ATP pyrophosphohydrolase